MKRYFISIVIVLMVLTVYLTSFGQSENKQGRQNRKGQRGAQSIAAEEKNKPQKERQSISEEERQTLRDKMRERAAGGSLMSGRQVQLKVIENIEQQLAKLKEAIKQAPDREEFRKIQEPSSEQQAKFRKEWQEARKQQEQIISSIQQQLTRLAGSRPPAQVAKPDMSFDELKAIYDLAIKENAKNTAERIEKLMAKSPRKVMVQPVKPEKPREPKQQTEPQKNSEGVLN